MQTPKYQIVEQLPSAAQFLIYRAVREEDGKAVIIKMLSTLYPSEHALNRLRTEYSVLESLAQPGVIHALGLEMIENRLAIVLEDDGGTTLDEYIAKSLPSIREFYPVAIQLAKAVQGVHAKRIIHKNINPLNIILDPKTNVIKLAGFHLATKLGREALYADSREAFEADLTFISPEQTGRMNSTIDYRTDMYSLGVVLYQLLTGFPPFVADDPMEIVHSHIARQPKTPDALRSEVPKSLATIIMKLLSKNKEDRYQSASGLQFDLQRSNELFQLGLSTSDFIPGEKDFSDQFRISEKIYGREAELNQLRAAFQRAGNGPAEMLIIAGYSGVGKSRLVKYVQKSHAEAKGFFISGKFDQFKRNEPLSSLLSAFRELIRQLLTQSKEQIAEWRSKVLDAVGTTGQVIVDVLPEIELLTGRQNALPDLPPVEAKNRFNETFNRFVRVFCQNNHPLCIFLDDLQWIDSATRQWIETQLIDQNTGNLLLIGAYRDNEVTASHPLMLMLDRLSQNHVHAELINLKPLELAALNEMIADTLSLPPENCAELSKIIFKKTDGNPFFIRQTLLSLHESGAIYFDADKPGWAYDLDLVQEAKISDNVVELMVQLIMRLPENVQDKLKIAACIGNRFDLKILSLVCDESLANTSNELAQALQEGLIIPFHSWHKEGTEEFTFLHDRVQQALMVLLHEEEKKKIRLKIARVLLSNTENLETEEKIYDIANHLNDARSLVTSETEIKKLASVNLLAGIRAKNASAYEQAKGYISLAMEVLPEKELTTPSDFTRELLLQRADCEHLCNNNELAETYYDKALALATTVNENAKIFQHKIHYFINLGKFKEAYNTGRAAVRPLGVNLPPKFVPPLLVKDIILYKWLLGRRKIPDIIDLPEMTDENLKMAILLMSTFARAAYQIRPELCVALCFRIVNICLKHGNTEGVNVGYLAVGPIFFGAILKQKQTGFDIGQLTLALVEKFKSHAFKAESHFVVGYFAIPWRKPAQEMERYWQIAYEAGLETGDFFHASCACCGTIQSYYMRGVHYEEIRKTSDRYIEFLQRINNKEAIHTLQSVRQSIANLRGETKSNTSYSNDGFDEETYVKALDEFGSRHFAHYYFINKMQTLYLWDEYNKAYEISLLSDKYLKDSPGMLHTAEHFFYKGLIIAALYQEAGSSQKRKWKRILDKIRKDFAKYAEGSPSNFIHKAQLLNAEILRNEGRIAEAENEYYAAIASATKYGYTNIVALANQLMMRFHFNAGRLLPAGFHLRNAMLAYKAMGADAYAKFLRTRYPTLFDTTGELRQSEKVMLRATEMMAETGLESNLDLATVLKSSEAISREIRLPDLLASLMKIIIENAGAQRMVLLLQQDKELVVYGENIADGEQIKVLDNIPLDRYENIAHTVVNYVTRSGTPVILEDAAAAGDYTADPYISAKKPRSVLCAPLTKQGKLTGVIYVENNLTAGAFTQERVDLLILLSGQMAISIENALLYNNLEEKVVERTEQLNSKNIELEVALKNLQESQRRLLHAEKMASLGQMASGIAHEIQNPLNFVINFADSSESLIEDLDELIQTTIKMGQTGIAEEIDDLLKDLKFNNEKISTHGKRAGKIVKGMLMQTSAINEKLKPAVLSDLLDEAAERAKVGFLHNKPDFSPVFSKHYSKEIGAINCLPESLIKVFYHLFDNALYTIYEKKQKSPSDYQPEILVETSRQDDQVKILIRDNGEGIPEENRDKIFVPFFTTKPTGRGNTGNGLTICHQVISEGHKGDIEVISEAGNFTEFRIVLPLNN